MTKASLSILCLLVAAYSCDAYKILVVFPMPGKSHSFLGNGIVRHLLKAGHEVTLLTPFIIENPPSNLRQIDTSSLQTVMDEFRPMLRISEIMKKGSVIMQTPIPISHITRTLALKVFDDKNVQNFLQDKTQQFDLVIAEWLFNDFFASFAAIYNAPLIWFSSTEPDSTMLSIVDEHLNPSYNGFYITGSPPFSFTQRLAQLWYSIQVVLFKEIVMTFLDNRDYNRLVVPHIEARGRIASAFSDIKYNASLVLGMSHVSMGSAMRLPQIYKHIGGFHVEEDIKPLPKNLKNIIEDAQDGVIYFSMGSNSQSKDWPETMVKQFVEMFGMLNQTVIWKYEEDLPNLPKNLHILKWAPQQSILAHPNCILFITHGGILSTTETIAAGKPIIGIPVLGDQFANVIRAESKGFAIKVDLSYTMVNKLKVAIEEMLRNPKYTEKAKELSFIYHDRPSKPSDEVVHWAEHVIKTNGALHLRSPALLVPWYQKCYLDLAVLLVVIGILVRIALKVVLPVIFSVRFRINQKSKIN